MSVDETIKVIYERAERATVNEWMRTLMQIRQLPTAKQMA